jgi:hypothetical protein
VKPRLPQYTRASRADLIEAFTLKIEPELFHSEFPFWVQGKQVEPHPAKDEMQRAAQRIR